jgi:two-component system NarL family response regulator
MKISLLIADDHTLFRQGLARLLGDVTDFVVVAEAADGATAVARAVELAPDVALMDVHMPNVDGIEATRQIRTAHSKTQVVMLTVSDKDADLFGAIQAGARGYLLKNASAAEVSAAIRRVHAGEAMLSPILAARVLDELAGRTKARATDALSAREQEVLKLIAQGRSNKEIAAALALSENTVKTHVRHILDKLHLHGRAAAAAYAARSERDSKD